MRRLGLLLCALLLALSLAPAAIAQVPEEPDPAPTEEPDDDVLDPDEIPPESTPFPEACVDDAPLPEGSPDADYYYYCDAVPSAGGGPPESPRRREAATQPLAAQELPLTGHEPLLIALFGAGFLLAGAGLRLALRPDAPRR